MPEFREENLDEIADFIRKYPFITLVGASGTDISATQIPVLVERKEKTIILKGHIMRNTDHHKTLVASPQALCISTGPHCYVSSSWYTQRSVGSTWNYMTVQLKGEIRWMNDEETYKLLVETTRQFEAGEAQPELVEDMNQEYVRRMIKAIEGFEMVATDIRATFKLSQNRDDESYLNIVRNLSALKDAGSQAVAGEMKTRRPQLFSDDE